MAIGVGQADVQGVFQRHGVRCEVRPYYIFFEQRPPGAPSVGQRIHAGFDVDLFGALDKMEVPRPLREEADIVFGYFEAVAREVQSQVGQGCTVEIMGYPDSLVLRDHLSLRFSQLQSGCQEWRLSQLDSRRAVSLGCGDRAD